MEDSTDRTGATIPSGDDLDRILEKLRPLVGYKVKKALGAATPDWEDIVNEVLMQASEKIVSGEFRGESTIGTFVYTITSRRIIDHIRRKSRILRDAPEAGFLPDPHEEVERREQVELLLEAIRKLKPRHREALELFYLKELPREEVARRMGISPAKVSEWANYAKKVLRKIMAGRSFQLAGAGPTKRKETSGGIIG
jgi:RNA polymerase sigma-70 factor (ECF subfamily)